MSESKFPQRIGENILAQVIWAIIVRLWPTALSFGANQLEFLQNVLKTTLLEINQKQITLYHVFLFVSMTFSLFLIIKYLINKFKPIKLYNQDEIDSKMKKYLIEHNGLKWLVGEKDKKYEVSDYPFCPIHEVEFLPKIFGIHIMSFKCSVCGQSPRNELCVNLGNDIQNILDSKGIKYFPHKKYKGNTQINHTNLSVNLIT
jgi:hypothetical protein